MKFYKGFTIEGMNHILCGFDYEARKSFRDSNRSITIRAGFRNIENDDETYREMIKIVDTIEPKLPNDINISRLLKNKVISKFRIETDILD
ncbi:MAG: hypothetical protein UZ05_CHB002000238 [Chlorobi bacterium OLB5]|nr:MAG: hypothetical protein UZ05_CHB002000238 [Chlorobi bacterium OLB5]